jgi:uracil-DNA glycosylase
VRIDGAAAEIATALPKRLRHAGTWPLDPPRRARRGSDLRALQDGMDGCPDGRRPVLSGDGTEPAMLIGQAPGWREIETGLPFAHDAGRRLVGWLELAGIGVEDFRTRWYVTSVGKCYPGRRPGASVDSPPSRRDVQRWSPVLASEVALVAPQLLVLVGGLAHRFAFGEAARLDDLVGRPLAWDRAPGASVICLPHPSGASTWLNDPRRVALWRAAMRGLASGWSDLREGT